MFFELNCVDEMTIITSLATLWTVIIFAWNCSIIWKLDLFESTTAHSLSLNLSLLILLARRMHLLLWKSDLFAMIYRWLLLSLLLHFTHSFLNSSILFHLLHSLLIQVFIFLNHSLYSLNSLFIQQSYINKCTLSQILFIFQ